jgi:hypothetical protein
MPKRDPRRTVPAAEPPSLGLVLAAVDRAVRHGPRHASDAPRWSILEHLAIPRRSRGARLLAAQLETLEAEDLLQRSQRRGAQAWSLTAAGRRRLREADPAGGACELPESPQHRSWRSARTTAAQEIGRFSGSLSDLLERADGLLAAAPPPSSDVWLELAESLRDAARRLGSASYCLREWPEPDDRRADVDDHLDPTDGRLDPRERERVRARRLGRRNVWLWDERARG